MSPASKIKTTAVVWHIALDPLLCKPAARHTSINVSQQLAKLHDEGAIVDGSDPGLVLLSSCCCLGCNNGGALLYVFSTSQ